MQKQDNWQYDNVKNIYDKPFFELLMQARQVHLQNWDKPNEINIATLCSIKTGACPEKCNYCTQSAHFNTDLKVEPLMEKERVLEAAKQAKENGAKRFCMGAAFRGPNDKQLPPILEMIKEVKALGLETCATLGLLKDGQAEQLKEAGLDYYNHNIDTSPEYYDKIISTRTFEDRINTIKKVQDCGLKVCCGGILGMGETVEDRLKMLLLLANMQPVVESVPINQLIPMPGTPLAQQQKIDSFDFIRIIAVARILLAKSYIRIAAGRNEMNDEMQALCFFAGANSIFAGDKLLTDKAKLPGQNHDEILMQKLGLTS
jgi:biotin synthase